MTPFTQLLSSAEEINDDTLKLLYANYVDKQINLTREYCEEVELHSLAEVITFTHSAFLSVILNFATNYTNSMTPEGLCAISSHILIAQTDFHKWLAIHAPKIIASTEND